MTSGERDFEAFRDDFAAYLADRLGVSKEEALLCLGDWLVAFSAEAHPPPLSKRHDLD